MQTHGNKGIQSVLFLLLLLGSFMNASESEMEHFSFAHEVKVLVSDTEIVAGNVIRIKIRATGDKVVFPNIEEIDGVKVLDQKERVTNMFHYVNGNLQKERTTLILTFAPHHDVTIPSYDIEIDGKVYKSEPVKIKVMPATDQNREDGNKFFLHLEADKKSVIVGEPILVTVYLSLKIGIRLTENPQYTKPLFDGFFATEVGEEKTYTKGNRQVTELKYILTPLEEGTFKVGPARARIGLADRQKRDMFGRFIGTTWHPIASNRVTINVAKKPQESDLVGDFKIEHTLDTQKVKANKPVNLTVTISGEGSLEDFIFLPYEIDGVTVYSDDAEIESKIVPGQNGEVVHSIYRKKFAFISDRDFTIPSRSVSLYDTKSKTVKYLEIPSYDVHVEGVKVPAVHLPKPPGTIPKDGQAVANDKADDMSMLYSKDESVLPAVQAARWWMMVLAFVLGMLVMYLFRYVVFTKWQSDRSRGKELEALKKLYAYSSESKEVEDMVRKLYAKRNGDSSVVIDKQELKMLVERYGNR